MEKVLFDMLVSIECKFDVWMMNIIFSVFGNMGKIDMMESWYEKFRNFGIEFEIWSFNILIGVYGKKRMYDKMLFVMEYMCKFEFFWMMLMYNNIIEVFADVGDVKNMEYMFDQMCSEGMKVDMKIFCCFINGYVNVGFFYKVISSVQLVVKFEIFENIFFYNVVILVCVKVDDLIEMERVYMRMKERECVRDLRMFEIMVEVYEKEGMNDKIYYLE